MNWLSGQLGQQTGFVPCFPPDAGVSFLLQMLNCQLVITLYYGQDKFLA